MHSMHAPMAAVNEAPTGGTTHSHQAWRCDVNEFAPLPGATQICPRHNQLRDVAGCCPAWKRAARRPRAHNRGLTMIQLHINGTLHTIDVDPQMPLLWAIRDIVGLRGTKFGCGVGACGACTV